MKNFLKKIPFIPSKQLWNKWDLQTQFGYITAWIGIPASLYTICIIVFGVFNPFKESAPKIDDKNLSLQVEYLTLNRPKDLLPQSFYLHNNMFSFIRGYPFDIYLGLRLEEFRIRYSSFIDEIPTPIEGLQLYCLKSCPLTEQRDTGRFNLNETYFLFQSERLVYVKLGLIFPPEKEQMLYGTLDKLYPNFEGKRYNNGDEFVWISEDGLHQELLFLFHGYGSGVNYFSLFQVTFPINELQLQLQNFDYKIDSKFEGFRIILLSMIKIMESELYINNCIDKLELVPGVIEYSIYKIRSIL